MNINEVKELLTQFDQSTLTEFDLKNHEFELYFNKNQTSRGTNKPTTTTSEQVSVSNPVAAAKGENLDAVSNTTPAVQPLQTPEVAGTEIVSPLVGVVYLKPAPDQADFKQVGDQVKQGDVLCIVEAMKVMNEITSDVNGELVAVLVENEDIVEFSQPLFIVKEG